MLLGVHVSSEGKIYEAVDRVVNLGCNVMQIFSRSPRTWRNTFLDKEDIEEFKKRRQDFSIKQVFIHIPYLINLASPNHELYEASIRAYIEDIQEADKLEADYLVIHMGSHKDTSEEAGVKRFIAALNRVLEKTKDAKVGLLLENTSGSGSWLGYKFSHQRKIIEGLKHKERIGLCLDTAHAYLAGYDISTLSGLKEILNEIEVMVGIEKVRLIHLNDAKDKLGSRHDRHEHIGKGNIGLAGMRNIINHHRLKNKPFILETPKDTPSADKINLEAVRRLRKHET